MQSTTTITKSLLSFSKSKLFFCAIKFCFKTLFWYNISVQKSSGTKTYDRVHLQEAKAAEHGPFS